MSAGDIQRLELWPEYLSAFVEARRCVPFAWGQQDCCLFAADGVAAITGRDLAQPWRGYRSALGAARVAAQAGARGEDRWGVSLWPVLAGLPEVPPAMAQRGDVVLIATGSEPGPRALCLGLCLGIEAAAPGAQGLLFYRRPAWSRAWRVG